MYAYVCVHVLVVGVCTCEQEYMYSCAHMWKPEVHIRCLPVELSLGGGHVLWGFKNCSSADSWEQEADSWEQEALGPQHSKVQ